MNVAKHRQVTAYVDDKELQEITKIAESYGVSRAQIARTALRYIIRMHQNGEQIFFPLDLNAGSLDTSR